MAKTGISPLLLLGGGAAMLLLARKRDAVIGGSLGVDVVGDCEDVRIVDYPSFEVYMLDVYTAKRAEGVEDPFVIADRIAYGVSPACRKFPDDMQSVGELEVYSSAIKFATIELTREKGIGIIGAMKEKANEYAAWLADQTSRLVQGPPVGNVVMLIEDGDVIQIGTTWLEETYFPMLEHVKENLGLLFTEGTALTVAVMIIKDTAFIDQDGNPIEVDLKQSPGGQKFLDDLTDRVRDYISENK